MHVQGIQKKLELYKKWIQRGDIHSLLVSQGHTGTCTVCKQRGFQYIIQGVIEVNSYDRGCSEVILQTIRALSSGLWPGL